MPKGGGGVSQKKTIADEGGEGVNTRPNLADIICEQPLIGLRKLFFGFTIRRQYPEPSNNVLRSGLFIWNPSVTRIDLFTEKI